MKQKIFSLLILSSILISSQALGFEAKIKWSADIEAPASSGIAISHDRIILGDSNGKIHALSLDSGAELWSYYGMNAACGTPIIIGNEVIFAQADGEITCIDFQDGSLIWRFLPVDEIDSRLEDGVIFADGLFYVASTGGKISAIDMPIGEEVWSYQANQGLRSAPAYGEGLIFQGEYDGLFSILDAKTGERLNGGGASAAVNTPIVNDGKVYFSAWDGSVKSVQIKDVIPLWSVKLGDPVTTSPVLSGNMLLVGTARGLIFALNEEDGKTLWQYDTNGGIITANPVVADGLVFACSSDGVVHVIEASTGKALHRLRLKQGIETDAAYSSGTFFFAGSGGIVYALY